MLCTRVENNFHIQRVSRVKGEFYGDITLETVTSGTVFTW